jgi:hypothetical protein
MFRGARVAFLGSLLVCGCAGRREKVEPPPSPAAAVAAVAAAAPKPSCRAPLGLDVVPIREGRSGSTVVLARVHGRLLAYAADEEASVVRVLDVESPRELGAVHVGGKPGRMVMMSGGRLAVTLTDRAEVAVYTPSPTSDDGLDLRCSLATPDEPVDVATTPGEETLLVTSDWGHALTGFDPETGEKRFDVDLPRGPRALLVAGDGRHAYIAHAAGRSMTTVDLANAASGLASGIDLGGESRELDGSMMMLMAPMPPPRDFLDHVPRASRRSPPMRTLHRSACQGFALAELSLPLPRVLEPMVEVASGDLEVQSSGYGSGASVTPELPVVAVVDEEKGAALAASVRAKEPDAPTLSSPCLLPRAAVVSKGSLYVACMGIDALVEYDASADAPVDHERRRWSVGGGPTGIAMHGSEAVVWSEFEGVASFVSMSKDGEPAATPVRVYAHREPRSEEEERIALGQKLFHTSSDKRISSDGRACASCHPGGRDDGLVWSTPGGPRQTPMLAGRLPETAPYGWDGAGADVTQHVGHTFARLEGKGLAPRDLDALVHYATTLPGPDVHASADAEARDQGRAVFFSAGCGSCHAPESGYSDGKRHDVKSGGMADLVAAFDTPSLRFVGQTAPYFHDGRYATLRSLLTDKEGPMSAARDRPKADIDALETFVRSL